MSPGPAAPQNLRPDRRCPGDARGGPPLAGPWGMALEGRRIEVQGTVQGVGFRPWIYRLARDLGLGGKVHNDARGVTIEAFGHPQ
jgi:Acylphosphatase